MPVEKVAEGADAIAEPGMAAAVAVPETGFACARKKVSAGADSIAEAAVGAADKVPEEGLACQVADASRAQQKDEQPTKKSEAVVAIQTQQGPPPSLEPAG